MKSPINSNQTLPKVSSLNMSQYYQFEQHGRKKFLWLALNLIIFWFLWGERNWLIFGDASYSFDYFMDLLLFHALYWCKCKHYFTDYNLSSLASRNPPLGIWGYYPFISLINSCVSLLEIYDIYTYTSVCDLVQKGFCRFCLFLFIYFFLMCILEL